MTVGAFVAIPLDSHGTKFRIVASTLHESDRAIKEMATKVFKLAASVSPTGERSEDIGKPIEFSVDLPKGYYSFSVVCFSASGERPILTIAVKSISIALFTYAIEACKNRINMMVDGLRKDARVPRELMRDLHIALERELEVFKL